MSLRNLVRPSLRLCGRKERRRRKGYKQGHGKRECPERRMRVMTEKKKEQQRNKGKPRRKRKETGETEGDKEKNGRGYETCTG